MVKLLVKQIGHPVRTVIGGPPDYLAHLVKTNQAVYVDPDAEGAQAIGGHTLAELKAKAAELGLPVSGTKKELAAAIAKKESQLSN